MRRNYILTSLLCLLTLNGIPVRAQDATYSFTVTAREGGAFSITAVVTPVKQSRQVPLKQEPGEGTQQANQGNGGNPNSNQNTAANQDTARANPNSNIGQNAPAGNPNNAARNQNAALANASANTNAATVRPVTRADVEQITRNVNQQLTRQYAQQQQQLVARLQQQQNQLTNQILANQRAQAQQIGNAVTTAQRAQQQAADQIRQQLQAQQNFIANAYQQFMRDQAMRNFDQNMMQDPNMRRLLGNNNRNLPLLRRLANQLAGGDWGNGMGNGLGNGTGGRLNADEASRKLEELSSKLPDEVAQKVMDSLRQMDAEKSEKTERNAQDQFAKLNEQLALLIEKLDKNVDTSKTFSPDDYEHLFKLGEQVDNLEGKRILFELALEAAGRVAGRAESGEAGQKKARDFALKLAQTFRTVKSGVPDDDVDMRYQLDYDVEKCMRISGAEDFYATSQG